MVYQVKGCLEDTSPDLIIFHNDRNNLKDNSTFEDVADKTLNLASLVKTSKNQIFVSSLIIRNDKLNKKDNEVNELLKNKCGTSQLLLVDNKIFLTKKDLI